MYIRKVAEAVVDFVRRRKATRKFRTVIQSKPEYVIFDDEGAHYGWEGVAEYFVAWEAVSQVFWRKDEAIVWMGRHRIRFQLDIFDEAERKTLYDYLATNGLLTSSDT
jgi:hypothetical protein